MRVSLYARTPSPYSNLSMPSDTIDFRSFYGAGCSLTLRATFSTQRKSVSRVGIHEFDCVHYSWFKIMKFMIKLIIPLR